MVCRPTCPVWETALPYTLQRFMPLACAWPMPPARATVRRIMTAGSDIQVVALGGGSGTRFWPVSRRSHPKHLQQLGGKSSLLAETFERVNTATTADDWWMVVGAEHAEACRTTVPMVAADRVLIEPLGRNTAAAIALAAIHIDRQRPGNVMAVFPADAHVRDAQAFCDALKRAATLATSGGIVTLGITPAYAETGYGYIRRGEPNQHVPGAFAVRAFLEKPDQARAQQFLDDGDTYWNAGIFVMRPDAFLAEVRRQLPALYSAMLKVQDAIGQPQYEDVLAEVYSTLESVSVDYGVMEHAEQMGVVPVDCGWSDVGSWRALGTRIASDGHGNVCSGRTIALGSHDCVLYAQEGHVVAAVGLEGLVVVHTADATLVMPAERAQQVREVIAQLDSQGWREYL